MIENENNSVCSNMNLAEITDGMDAKTEKRVDFFRKMIPVSIIFASLMVFCCYDNYSGITVVLFQMGLPFMAGFMLKRIGYDIKISSYGYMAIMFLVGLSGFFTLNMVVVVLNYCAEFLLLVTMLLHNCADDYGWDFSKYFGEIIKSCFWSFIDAFSLGPVFDCIDTLKSRGEASKKNKYAGPVIIGILIGIPFVAILCGILGSADSIFEELIFTDLWDIIDFELPFGKIFLFIFALTACYCGMRYIKEKSRFIGYNEARRHGNVTIITVSVMVTAVYLLFSMIQILFLFAGNFKLPQGMNYALYARQGFFQLLFVSAFNLFAVLMIKKHFEENNLLQILLYIITGCTYVMTFSSGFRMIMYIDAYGLTTLRVLVMVSLAVIAVLLVGVVLKIRNDKFGFFRFGTLVVSIFYIAYAFSHSEYFIAEYDLNNGLGDDLYVLELSADAYPAIRKYANNICVLDGSYTKEEWIKIYEENNRCGRNVFSIYENEIMNEKSFKSFNLSKFIGNSVNLMGYDFKAKSFIIYSDEKQVSER